MKPRPIQLDKMIRTYRDFVEEFRGLYHEEIKPLIQNGHLETARSLLFNIVETLKSDRTIFNYTQIPTVHSGLNLLASIKTTYEKLGEKDFNVERDTLHLEEYLAQTKLPTHEQVLADSAR